MPIKWLYAMLVAQEFGNRSIDDGMEEEERMMTIFSRGPFITAINRCYCVDHFTCSHCSTDLMDCGFVEEDGKLYCEKDFEELLAPHCEKCSQKILKVNFSLRTEPKSLELIIRNVFMPWKKIGILNVFSVLHVKNRSDPGHFMWKKVNRTVSKVCPCRWISRSLLK